MPPNTVLTFTDNKRIYNNFQYHCCHIICLGFCGYSTRQNRLGYYFYQIHLQTCLCSWQADWKDLVKKNCKHYGYDTNEVLYATSRTLHSKKCRVTPTLSRHYSDLFYCIVQWFITMMYLIRIVDPLSLKNCLLSPTFQNFA